MMYQRWLICLYLICVSNFVSAFYPYQNQDNSGDHPAFFTRHERSQDLSERDGQTEKRESSEGSNPPLLKLDIHKVERRDNQFSKLISETPTMPNAMAIDQDGSDYSYFSAVKFGSKSQIMYMLIDTGSANTWVFSSSCQSQTCSIHNTFGPEDSTTLQTTSETWALAYGTGEVEGIVGSDTINFANFTVNMGFGLATNASNDFNNYPMDGIMGLGRTSSDSLGTSTIMQALDNQGHLVQNILGVHLNRAADNTKDGEIVFGGVDTTKFTGSIAFTETVTDDSWEVPVDDVLVNGTPCKFTNRTAIVDTGTTFLLMPPADAQVLHALIPGAQANGETYTLPCNSNAKVEVKINGKLYSVSPKDYVGNPVSQGSSTCSSTIIGHQAFGVNQWILGDVFLKNVYAVFDFDGARIGFGLPGSGGSADLSTPSSSSSSSSTTSSSSSSSSSTATTSPSGTTTHSGSPSSTDSAIGGGSQSSATRMNVLGYWKVGFSICISITFSFGLGLI